MICILYLKVFHLKFYVFTYPKNLCPAWFVLSKCDLASELIFYQFEGVVDVFLSDCIIRLFHLTVHLRKKAKWKYNSIFFLNLQLNLGYKCGLFWNGSISLDFFCDLHEKFLLEKYVVLVLKSPVLKFQFQKFSSKSHSSCFKVTFLFF